MYIGGNPNAIALSGGAGHGAAFAAQRRGGAVRLLRDPVPGTVDADAGDRILAAARRGIEERQLAVLGTAAAAVVVVGIYLASGERHGKPVGPTATMLGVGGVLLATFLVSRIYDNSALAGVRSALVAQSLTPTIS